MHTLIDYLFSLKTLSPGDLLKAHYSFALGQPWLYLMFALALILAVLGYFSYRKQSASPAKRIVMGVIRALIIIVVVLLFCRPQATVDQELKTSSVVAVWLDNSQSMELRDPYKDPAMKALLQQVAAKSPATAPTTTSRPTRFDLALHALSGGKDHWLKTLAEKQDVAIFVGGGHTSLLGIAHSPDQIEAILTQLRSQKPLSDSTDVPTVITEMFRQLQGQPVSALVLLTDGRSTEGTLPTVATTLAQQYHTPIFSLPLGQAQAPLNLTLSSIQMPENTFAKDPVVVKVKLNATGLDHPTPVKLHLLRQIQGAPQELLKKEVTLDPAKPDQEVELIFKPELRSGDKNERYDLQVKADPIGDELTLSDNALSGATTVMDAKVTVLYVEGQPRWEYRYLWQELKREKTIDVSCLLLSADEGFAQEGDIPITRFPENAEELRKYDVLLIGDVDPQFFSPNQMRLIVDFVKKEGGGLGLIAGPLYNPDSYKGTPLEPLLPIVPDDPNAPTLARFDNAPFTLRLTPAGKESNLFRFFDNVEDNVRQMADNPEMYWFKPVLGLKGAAEVLAEHPTRSLGGMPAPLIVTGRYGSGRVLYSAVADTWRWRRYNGEPLYQSYWLQMCRLLYREKALGQSKRLEVVAENPVVEVGRPLRISAQVKDATLAGTVGGAAGQITMQVFDSNGRPLEPLTLSRVGTSGETFQGLMTPTQTGKLRLEVTPGLLPFDVAPLEVTVHPPEREFANSAADFDSLGTLARRTDGQVLPLTSAGQLATLISDKSQLNVQPKSEELWSKPIALFLLLGLLTAEWLVRKSAGLI